MNTQRGGYPAGTAEPVAIIGMSCNLPGGNRNPDQLWSFLLKRRSGIRDVPADRWNAEAFHDPDPDALAKSVSKWGGFIDDVRGFDAQFFGISPREAAAMDPQQRLVLQAAFEAIEDSGRPLSDYRRQVTGVFVGVSQSEYRTLQEMRITNTENYAGTGYALCINANRVSHRMNLTGPSYAVDTACSSSMTALDQAVRNLHGGACDTAIVAGVNILVHPSSFLAFSKAGMISPTGRISTFDASANGFVRGEGVGVVIVKPLGRAQADGDRIHAVIHATHVNQDGYTPTITAPDQAAQIDMLRGLFARTSVRPDQVGFVEAHGTGTPIGDPIEAGAIGTVIGQATPDRAVRIGSIKANIGHLESGAGVAGLIKAALSVGTGTIAPNVNFREPNPNIPLDALNLRVPVAPEPFPMADDGGRYAVVNSFGFGGTNASALVSAPPEGFPAYHPAPAAAPGTTAPDGAAEWGADIGLPLFFPISGASEAALRANAAALLEALRAKGRLFGVALPDIAAALANTRSHLIHRAVILARDLPALKRGLRRLSRGEDGSPDIVRGQVRGQRKLCFMFSGQGSQWWAMARDLLEHSRVFSDAVEAYDRHFEAAAGWSIRQELLSDEATSRIDDTTVTQPALFAIQSGLAALWGHLGVRPDMVVGHSIGEAAAAHVAGGLTLEGAATFLSRRGAIRDQLGARGAMAAIGLHHEDVEALLPPDGTLGIAAINGPGSTTISGDYEALHAFVEDFSATRPDTFIRALAVDTAWHSYQLDAGEAWFRREVDRIDWTVPHLPFISTVTGKPECRFDADYGWLNLRQPVRFRDAVEAAVGLGATTFLELGPAATLAGPARSTALEAGAPATVLNSLTRGGNDFDDIARAAASLFVEGHDLDWSAICGRAATRVDLPRYAWAEEAHWHDSEESRAMLGAGIKHPFLGQRERGNGTTWTSEINLRAYSWLKDHRLQSDVIFPAAGYLDSLIAMGRELFGDGKPIEIEDAHVHEALFIAPEDEVLFSAVYSADRGSARVYSRIRDGGEDWVLRSDARIRATDVPPPAARRFDPRRKGLSVIDRDYAYDVDGRHNFINYGDAFHGIREIWMTGTKTFARIKMTEGARSASFRHPAHPVMLDACLQVVDPRFTLAKVRRGRQPGDPVYLPVGAAKIRVYDDFPEEIFVEATQVKDPARLDATAGFIVRDGDGRVLMTVDGLRMRALQGRVAAEEDGEVPAHFVRQDLIELRLADDAPPRTGHWLVLDNGGPDGAALARAMRAGGAEVTRVARGDLGEDPGGTLTDMAGEAIADGAIEGIVAAWPLAVASPKAPAGTPTLFEAIEACTRDLIGLGDMMDFARAGQNGLPEIVVLTSGAYPAPGAEGAVDGRILTQMPAAALARGLATETPEFRVRLIDTDAGNLASPARLARHVLTPTPETEIVLAGDRILAPRLRHAAPDDFEPRLMTVSRDDRTVNFHATMRSPGVIDHVELSELPLQPVAEGEVRVRVSAVGLNFRDIMAVTGLLPTEAEPDPAWQNLGLEFGGVVEAVGDAVEGFVPGDRVMGLGRRCLQRFVTVDSRSLVRVPDEISLAQAATIPSAFATAHYALNHVGRMQPGERVFIHVATGGVGTAAVQLAQAGGAEIFATAGNPAKRRRLRDLGVPHVMDSRSLKFADDVMRITRGRGVDILLNSLPGDYIAKGLGIMAPYGRFLEIGKRDVYNDSSVGMKALRRNVSLSVLDLAAMGAERPQLMKQMFDELAEMLESAQLEPLPCTEFPISRIGEAIRYMSQARHVGKVVVTLEDERFRVRRDANRPAALRADASYLVTGGTAGFSRSIAEWMGRNGAGRLYLASRSGTLDRAGERLAARLEKSGVEVRAESLDVTDAGAVRSFVAAALADDKPLRGVVHGAAVIRDGFVNQMTPGMIRDVLGPKVAGGWNLHAAFAAAGTEPDFLIGFSSISPIVGSAGQANYIAANAFLDALAHYRRSLDRPGSAIDWGVIADAGFVTRKSGLASYLESVGMFGLRRREFGPAMALSMTRDAPSFVYSRADWPQVLRANPSLGSSPRMAGVLRTETGGTLEVRERLLKLEGEALIAEARAFIMDEIANVLKVDRETIQTDRPMSELGLDSLSSFELKIRIETALDYALPVSRFLQAPSVEDLSHMLAQEIEGMRRAESARKAERDDEASGKRPTARGVPATNGQIGLIGAARSPLTSDHARIAMDHVVRKRVPAGIDAEMLGGALKRLARRHPLMRMRPGVEGRLTLDAPLPAIESGARHEPLDSGGGEFLRVGLSADGTVELRMHAAMGDAVSARTALDELLGLAEGRELPRPVTRRAVLNALASCHFDPEDPRGQNDRAFWWYALSGGAAPVRFPGRGRALVPGSGGRDQGPAAGIRSDLPRGLDEAAALLALAAALRSVTKSSGPVLMARTASIRPWLKPGPAIGPFTLEQPIAVPGADANPAALATFNRVLANSAAHTRFDCHAAAREFAGRFAEWGVSPFQIAVATQGRLDRPVPAGALHDLSLELRLGGRSPAFRLIYDTDVIGPDLARDVAAAFLSGIDGRVAAGAGASARERA